MTYASLGSYNPYINYTWEMLPNAKVKNSGSGVDLQLYSGNPLDFQGSQEIAIGNTFGRTFSIVASGTFDQYIVSGSALTNVLSVGYSTYNGVRFRLNTSYQYIWENTNIKNVKSTIIINATDTTIELFVNGVSFGIKPRIESISSFTVDRIGSIGASRYMDGDFDYLTFSNSVLTQTQITQSVEQPNQFFKDMSINSNTLFATDFRGNGGYIADSKNYSEGSQLFINPDFTIDLNGWFGTKFLSWNNGGCSFNSDRNDSLYQYNASVGKIYKCIFKIRSITTGSIKCIFGPSTMSASVTSEGEYTFIGKCKHYTQPDGYASYLSIDGTGTDAIIEYAFAYEVSGVYPITNYSATQRTNFTQVNKGLQDLTRKFDSNGFFLDNTDYLNCNGKGKATIIEPSRTSNITIKTNPTTLSGNILSGGVVKTTTGLTSGVDNDIVLSNQVISSNIDIGVGYTGKISIYKEGKL